MPCTTSQNYGTYTWAFTCWKYFVSFLLFFLFFICCCWLSFLKNYLKIRSSPHSTLFMELFVLVCAFSCLLSSPGFLLSDFSGINQKHCARRLYILLDKQKGCWTCTIVCLWSHTSLNKCEGHGFVKSLWIFWLQVSLPIIQAIGILFLVISETIINCYYLPAFQA